MIIVILYYICLFEYILYLPQSAESLSHKSMNSREKYWRYKTLWKPNEDTEDYKKILSNFLSTMSELESLRTVSNYIDPFFMNDYYTAMFSQKSKPTRTTTTRFRERDQVLTRFPYRHRPPNRPLSYRRTFLPYLHTKIIKKNKVSYEEMYRDYLPREDIILPQRSSRIKYTKHNFNNQPEFGINKVRNYQTPMFRAVLSKPNRSFLQDNKKNDGTYYDVNILRQKRPKTLPFAKQTSYKYIVAIYNSTTESIKVFTFLTKSLQQSRLTPVFLTNDKGIKTPRKYQQKIYTSGFSETPEVYTEAFNFLTKSFKQSRLTPIFLTNEKGIKTPTKEQQKMYTGGFSETPEVNTEAFNFLTKSFKQTRLKPVFLTSEKDFKTATKEEQKIYPGFFPETPEVNTEAFNFLTKSFKQTRLKPVFLTSEKDFIPSTKDDEKMYTGFFPETPEVYTGAFIFQTSPLIRSSLTPIFLTSEKNFITPTKDEQKMYTGGFPETSSIYTGAFIFQTSSFIRSSLTPSFLNTDDLPTTTPYYEDTETHGTNKSTPHSKDDVKAKCYMCGLNETEIPRAPTCYQVFDSIERTTKTSKKRYKVHCFAKKSFRRSNNNEFVGDLYRNGCFKRFTDVGMVYNERGCRTMQPTKGMSFASNRFAKLELLLADQDEGCVASPHASLTPFSRAISLFVRYHVCVCKGRYCNEATRHSGPPFATSYIIFCTFVYLIL